MPDMSQIGKKEFPAQTENRKQWIIETVRANQEEVTLLLMALLENDYELAGQILAEMHKLDRDALLLPNGVLTAEQIERLQADG